MSPARRVALFLSALTLLAVLPASSGAKTSFKVSGRSVVSESAGLGRLEVAGDTAAVLQRDEGIVALLDVSDPSKPKVLGRYDDGAEDSFDGDLVFSKDGKWLIYARQTHQFSKDGIHVIDVSDPKSPQLASYAPGGGAYRIEYFEQAGAEWVVLLDAITGMVVYRFESTTGQLVPVHVDALPALKVGGPASAGLYFEPKDKGTGAPLLYVTTGKTGLQVYDFTDPTSPNIAGRWRDEIGLAEVEVRTEGKTRTVYAATEYWFNKQLVPEVIEIDASNLSKMKEVRRISLGAPADEASRIQGMALVGSELLVAHSTLGLRSFDAKGKATGAWASPGPQHEAAGVQGRPYTFDVEVAGGQVYTSDASSGTLTILRHLP